MQRDPRQGSRCTQDPNGYHPRVPRITFLPDGVTVDVSPGTSVFNAAVRADVAIPSQCGGKCACALCRVRVVSADGLISPMRWDEECHMGNAYFLTHERLSCQLQVFGDLTVEIPEAPVKEQKRGRYIPHALVRKREKMEQEAELARVRGESRPPRPPRRAPDEPRPPRRPPGADGPPPGVEDARPPQAAGPRPDDAPPGSSSRRRRRRRGRNPGAPRSGDSRPPPGAKPDTP